MKPISPKKLVASAIIFLFTNISTPVLAATPLDLASTSTQKGIATESISLAQAPTIQIGAPRIVHVTEIGLSGPGIKREEIATIRNVDYSYTLLNDLKSLVFSYDKNHTQIVNSPYGNVPGGYVCMAPTNLKTGFLQIQKANNLLEKNLQGLLAAPEKFNVRSDLVNVQFAPKIISDFSTHSLLLAMEPWDFRLVAHPQYNDTAINQLFLNAYSTFKGFAQITKKQAANAAISLHTGYWGLLYHNNPRVTTAVQLLASHMARIDTMIFHINQTGSYASVMADAQAFVQQQSGKNIGDVLTALVAQSQTTNWNPGTA